MMSRFEDIPLDTIKKKFMENPAIAKSLYALNLNQYDIQGGCTLYKGNCLLKKECVERLADYLGLGKPIFSKVPKKHNITFYIKNAECEYNGRKAIINCPAELEEQLEEMAEYMYPSECISIHII